MQPSVVYFVDAHARNSNQSLLNKLGALFSHLGLAEVVAGKRVAIKTHVGAPLCTRIFDQYSFENLWRR